MIQKHPPAAGENRTVIGDSAGSSTIGYRSLIHTPALPRTQRIGLPRHAEREPGETEVRGAIGFWGWNPGELPEGWSIEKLLGRHPSEPYNPDIAQTFYRSGDTEAWARGIQRILRACREAGTPEPKIRVEARDVWVEFPFSAAYLEKVAEGSGEGSGGTTQMTTTERILDVLRTDPTASRKTISEHLKDITENGVKYHLEKLKDSGQIRRVGPDRGGCWEILENES